MLAEHLTAPSCRGERKEVYTLQGTLSGNLPRLAPHQQRRPGAPENFPGPGWYDNCLFTHPSLQLDCESLEGRDSGPWGTFVCPGLQVERALAHLPVGPPSRLPPLSFHFWRSLTTRRSASWGAEGQKTGGEARGHDWTQGGGQLWAPSSDSPIRADEHGCAHLPDASPGTKQHLSTLSRG